MLNDILFYLYIYVNPQFILSISNFLFIWTFFMSNFDSKIFLLKTSSVESA